MSPLLALPIEALHEITAKLLYKQLDDSVPPAYYTCVEEEALRALCLTCRRLRDVAQPILFSVFLSQQSRREENLVKRFARFARTIAIRGDLRKSVRIFDMSTHYASNSDSLELPSGSGLQELQEAAPAYFQSREVRDNGVMLHVGEHVMGILSLLPNLRVLKIEGQVDDAPDFCRLVDLMDNFQKLEELQLVCEELEDLPWLRVSDLAPLLRLPELKKFSVKTAAVYDIESAVHLSTFEEKSLSVEEVSMENCVTTNASMHRLIRAFRQLTRFKYTNWTEADEEAQKLDTLVWHSALSEHKDTLQELEIDDLCPTTEDDLSLPTSWPSFCNFASLKVLRIEYDLLDYNGLPESLWTLHLFDCEVIQSDEELDSLCRIKARSCPDIEDVEIRVTRNK
ncbi:hypothetical protein BU26DRAFT_349340 [Trematosphaeria pertusa]|uniref:F-box domain-containing protein n=1 Tax=Trematosphaeria pertusa TaxID=390896 RepID=A0A6A6IAX6_9PLEO|nr:uncharacterized protein BU26DRAFT_349340 [Trematosphaeria pertusa]KAF2247541.1 hypothetical protein BU26DRAFT_349340 [Trematosphaeria pertusa]